MQENNSNSNCIIVVPFHPVSVNFVFNSLRIDKLYFWYKDTFDHPVNEETIKYFLHHAKLFGATVYPDCPELGCIAINVPECYNKGETSVDQIKYKGELVYLRTR